jgi:hypothetical protein
VLGKQQLYTKLTIRLNSRREEPATLPSCPFALTADCPLCHCPTHAASRSAAAVQLGCCTLCCSSSS